MASRMTRRMTRDWRRTASRIALAGTALAALGLATAAPAVAQYRQELRNDVRQCAGQAQATGEGSSKQQASHDVSTPIGQTRVRPLRPQRVK